MAPCLMTPHHYAIMYWRQRKICPQWPSMLTEWVHPAAPKAQEPSKESPKAAAPSLLKPPTLPKLEDLPKPAAPSSSGLPEPKQAAKQAVSAVKEAVPEAPQQAAKQAASAVKEAVPEAPQQAAKEATAALKSAAPEGPKQAAQDAASAAKEALPEAPKTNPFQSFFQGKLRPAQLSLVPRGMSLPAAAAVEGSVVLCQSQLLFDGFFTLTGPSKVEGAKSAGEDAASAVKSAVPDQPKDAAKDAASAIKESLPEAPRDIPNPLQNFLGEQSPGLLDESYYLADLSHRVRFTILLLRHSGDEQNDMHRPEKAPRSLSGYTNRQYRE